MSSAECGEGRSSRFACPADCAFSPFASANYRQLLELEEQVDRLCLDRLKEKSADPAGLARELQRAMSAKSIHSLHALIVWRFYFERDASGFSMAQRWERDGFPGLKNDARVLLRAKMKLRVALIEIRCVLDVERTEVVDLLDAAPQPFILRDRGLASSAARFATGLTWLYPLPHYHRLFGSAVLLQEVQAREPREVVEEIVRHLGGPTEEAGMRRWLGEHFVRCADALTAVGVERRRLMFTSIDAKFGKAVYELRAPFAECCEHLETMSDVGGDELAPGEQREGFAEARTWFSGPEDEAITRAAAGGEPVLGRVLLGQAHWRLETVGGAKLAVLRRKFEAHMGARVKFTGERLDDYGASMAEKSPKADLSLVPPRLLEHPQVMHLGTSRVPTPIGNKSKEELMGELFAAQDRAFLDDKIPALNGHTPREAARDPKLRPLLVRLMKSRVRATDERNLDEGRHDDVNWMLSELGLDEINFPAPPAGRMSRAFVGRESGNAEAFEAEDCSGRDNRDDDTALPMNPRLPCAPRLPKRPFTFDEVQDRTRAAFDLFEFAADALDRLEADGCTLIADVGAVTGELVDDNAYGLLVPMLANVWFVFAPPGTRGPNLSRTVLRDAIQRESLRLLDMLKLKSPAALEDYLESGPQPALAKSIIGMILHGAETLPKKQRPAPEKQAVLGAVLRGVIAELDRAHRGLGQ